jgi:hypothetical protein
MPILEAIGLGAAMLAAMSDSEELTRKTRVMQYLLRSPDPEDAARSWPKEWPEIEPGEDGVIVRVASAPMFNTPGMWRNMKHAYQSDPDYAIMVAENMGGYNRILAEALLLERIPMEIEEDGETIRYVFPGQAKLMSGWIPRPRVFGLLRQLANVWQNSDRYFKDEIWEDEQEDDGRHPSEADQAEWINERAGEIFNWVARDARPTKPDVYKAVEMLQELVELEDHPLVEPEALEDDWMQKVLQPAKEYLSFRK